MKLARPQDGFTLIEALVAMAILAIASAGLIRATEAHIDMVRGVQTRVVAQWVAENRLIELGLESTPPVARTEQVAMLGRDWEVDVTVAASEDPDLSRVTVAVSPAGDAPTAATLGGFVDVARSTS